MQDSQEPVPAQFRHVRRLGVMPCCLDTVLASKRLTRPGSEFQCRVCQAIYAVDAAGCWCYHGALTTLTPTGQRQEPGRSAR